MGSNKALNTGDMLLRPLNSRVHRPLTHPEAPVALWSGHVENHHLRTGASDAQVSLMHDAPCPRVPMPTH